VAGIVPRGIFWVLDNGAKWKELPRRLGSTSAVHRRFTLWGAWAS
jgi:transposase